MSSNNSFSEEEKNNSYSKEEEEEKIKQFKSIIDENEKNTIPISSDITDIENSIKKDYEKIDKGFRLKSDFENDIKELLEINRNYRMSDSLQTSRYYDGRYNDWINENKDIIRERRSQIRDIDATINDIENRINEKEDLLYEKKKGLNKLRKTIGETSDERDKIIWKDRDEESKRIDELRDQGLDEFGDRFSTGKFIKPNLEPEPEPEPEPKSLWSRVFNRSTQKKGGKRRSKGNSKKGSRRRRHTRKHRK
jgi:hypothetical protein